MKADYLGWDHTVVAFTKVLTYATKVPWKFVRIADTNHLLKEIKHSIINFIWKNEEAFNSLHFPLHMNAQCCYFLRCGQLLRQHLLFSSSEWWDIQANSMGYKQVLYIKALVCHDWISTFKLLKQTTLLSNGKIRDSSLKNLRHKSDMTVRCYSYQTFNSVVIFIAWPSIAFSDKWGRNVNEEFCTINNYTSGWIELFKGWRHGLVNFPSRKPCW